MFNSDFVWVNFDEDIQIGEESTRTFIIDEDPTAASGQPITAEGYLLIQARNVGSDNNLSDDGQASCNQIRINGRDLPAFDLVAHEGWNLWMDRIPDGFLQVGQNRLTIVGRCDRFHVANVVVQWRERKKSSGSVLTRGNKVAAG